MYFGGFSLDISNILGIQVGFAVDSCANDVIFEYVPTTSVPEPANMILLGTGLLGLVGIGRKKLFKR